MSTQELGRDSETRERKIGARGERVRKEEKNLKKKKLSSRLVGACGHQRSIRDVDRGGRKSRETDTKALNSQTPAFSERSSITLEGH